MEKTNELAKGAYVVIGCLQSDAGKKLNGGKGIILNNPTVADGVARYPVLFYATKNASGALAALNPTANKKIKAENISPDPQPPAENSLLSEVVQRECVKAQSGQAAAVQNAVFWLELYHKACPDNFGVATTYANFLRNAGRPLEAFDVIKVRQTR
ncbi:expressed unknown protein [Seminavis robusta]|uniref:Uncharacterized protein n=1 Tax=Seminavis robusta TaxID=568900 RepID=A0A9N8DL61_9STRA|nr:expressed unknown protein [Seminavis robusta]|eukprot:Sro184_g079920.1 n/a (156) ;mRNA; f:40031-40498